MVASSTANFTTLLRDEHKLFKEIRDVNNYLTNGKGSLFCLRMKITKGTKLNNTVKKIKIPHQKTKLSNVDGAFLNIEFKKISL